MIQLSIILTILILTTQASIDPIDPRHELLTEIVGRYRLAARHFRENQNILPFEIQYPIHDIIKVDSSLNEYILRATIQLNYKFDFLHWDSNDTTNRYYNINEILIPKTILQTLWLPDISFIDDDSVKFNLEYELVKINRYGYITWIRRGLFAIQSLIDLTYYPFDRQYIHLNMYNKQKIFKLQYQLNHNQSKIEKNSTIDSVNLWGKLLGNFEFNFPENTSIIHNNNNHHIHQSIISRGWFVQILNIEANNDNDTLEYIHISIRLQRRREAHIYTTILPTLFFSIFIFIYYFSSIESYQRLIICLLHILATLLFIIYLDRKISAEQLSYTPLIIRYLSIIFLIEILSLFFDHIIHSVYYGGIHFVSNWLHKKENYSTLPARLSNVKFLTESDQEESTDILMKQLIAREESLKLEDYQRYQWRKQARLSECICCWFFLIIVIVVFLITFFILPTLNLSKMT